MNFVEELRWRGMIHNIMPGTEEQLAKEQTTAYVGIDPTADSLHIGHLVSVMMMKHLQMAGHKPIFVIGGATGMNGICWTRILFKKTWRELKPSCPSLLISIRTSRMRRSW